MIGRLPIVAGGRATEAEALQVDTYLEELLASRAFGEPASRAAVPSPLAVLSPHPAPAVEPAVTRGVAELLARSLVRFHPSFRFEEGLADRLRAAAGSSPVSAGSPAASAAASAAADPSAADSSSAARLLPFPTPLHAAAGLPTAVSGSRARGVLLVSGVSLAGAALLAWRRGRRGPEIVQ